MDVEALDCELLPSFDRGLGARELDDLRGFYGASEFDRWLTGARERGLLEQAQARTSLTALGRERVHGMSPSLEVSLPADG